jgi:hypothetical protein
VRDYVQSSTVGKIVLEERFGHQRDVDLVDEEDPADRVESPGPSIRSPSSGNPATLRSRLPPRHLADPLVQRFFKHVHSVFWVFPQDQFLRKFDKTYTFYDLDLYPESPRSFDDHDRREIEISSWMCCLFTVLAFGAAADSEHELLKPSELFSYAKGLSRWVIEDESFQSIQALLLMVCMLRADLSPGVVRREY